MNGFLVMLVHTMDDLPVALFTTRGEAEQFAREQPEMPTAEQRKIFDADCSTPCAVKICEFQNGSPLGMELAKLFD